MIPVIRTISSNRTTDMMRSIDAFQDKHLAADPLERVGLSRDRVRELTRAMHHKQLAKERWKREGEPLDEYVLGMVSRHKRIYTRELVQLCGESPQAIAGAYARLRRAGFPIKKESVRVASSTGQGGSSRVVLIWEEAPERNL